MKLKKFTGFALSLIMAVSSLNVGFANEIGKVGANDVMTEDTVVSEEAVEIEDEIISGTVIDEEFGDLSSYDYLVDAGFQRYPAKGGYIYCDSKSIIACDPEVTEVTIPRSITQIAYKAFSDCKNLKSVDFTNSYVSYIGSYAFEGCTSLTKIDFPISLREIDSPIFYGCENLMSVKFDYDSRFTVKDNIIFSSDGTILYQCLPMFNKKSYTVPYDVKEIRDNAFCHCDTLETVSIPENVEKIYSSAFRYCTNLKSINLSNGITELAGSLFYGCSNLESITIPESVTIIHDSVFDFCTKLKTIHIPASVSAIGDGSDSGDEVFGSDTSLSSITVDPSNPYYTSVDGVLYNKDMTKLIKYPDAKEDISFSIPEGIVSIPYGSLRETVYTKTLILPKSIETINIFCLESGSIEEIIAAEDNPYFKSADGVLYNKDMTKLIKYPCNRKADSFKIPHGVTKIDYSAFINCSNLTSIEIPNSVTDIGIYAFRNVKKLKTIEIPDSVTNIDQDAFCYCNELTSVIVPRGVTKLDGVFRNCTNLVSIAIPETVEKINDSFDGCAQLRYIHCIKNSCAADKLNYYNHKITYFSNYKHEEYEYLPVTILYDYDSYVAENSPSAKPENTTQATTKAEPTTQATTQAPVTQATTKAEPTTQATTEKSTEATTAETTASAEGSTETTTTVSPSTETTTTTSTGGSSGGSSGSSSGGGRAYKAPKTATANTEASNETKNKETSEKTENPTDKAENNTEKTNEAANATKEENIIKESVKVTIGSDTVTIGDKEYKINAAPYIQPESSSTLVPLRFAVIAISGESIENADTSSIISWDADTKTAVINAKGKIISFTAGSSAMIIDGKSVPMENGVKAEIKESRMYIPFRALGNALGIKVDWDADTKTAIFRA